MNLAVERFERRLVQETSALRVNMAHGFSAVRQEMAQGFAAIRQEIAAQRIELGDRIADLYWWSFLFWIGQLAAMAALLSFMLRR